MGQKNYARGFELTLQPHMLDLPLLWKKPQRIFVNSMSDLLHADVPHDDVMTRASWHQFQVLTKRADRLADVGQHLPWPDNVWMGAIPLARAPAWTVAESGPGARPMEEGWVVDLRDQCLAADVLFFFKQWGGRNKKAPGRVLDGREWNEGPMVRAVAP